MVGECKTTKEQEDEEEEGSLFQRDPQRRHVLEKKSIAATVSLELH